MPNIKLIGFDDKQADKLIPKIAEAIKEKTQFADTAVITNYTGSTCVSAADINKPMPYFRIDTTTEEGTIKEFEQITEALKPFGFDIE